jgi:hypothetical protein
MPKKRGHPAESIGKLRHGDVLLGEGKKVAEVVQALGVTEVTDSRWRQEVGGNGPHLLPGVGGQRWRDRPIGHGEPAGEAHQAGVRAAVGGRLLPGKSCESHRRPPGQVASELQN